MVPHFSVTIVIPVKNCEKTIGMLLDSLNELDYPDPEVIVVDDGSSDKTRQIVEQYSVKLISLDEGHGSGFARNLGVQEAEGEIIAFIDGDAEAGPSWLASLLGGFNSPHVGCVGGSIRAANKDNFYGKYADSTLLSFMPYYKEKTVLDESNFAKLGFGHPISCNMAVRREVLETIGSFDHQFRRVGAGYEEVDFLWRLCRAGYKIVCEPKAVVYHRHRETLWELLKQFFRQGFGCSLFCAKHPTISHATKRRRRFFAASAFLVLLPFLMFWISSLPLFILASVITIAAPVIILFALYISKYVRISKRDAVLYAVIDLLRCGAHYCGEVYGKLYSLTHRVWRRP